MTPDRDRLIRIVALAIGNRIERVSQSEAEAVAGDLIDDLERFGIRLVLDESNIDDLPRYRFDEDAPDGRPPYPSDE